MPEQLWTMQTLDVTVTSAFNNFNALVTQKMHAVFMTFSHLAFRIDVFRKLAPKMIIIDEAAYKSARPMPLLYLESVELIIVVGDFIQPGERFQEEWLLKEKSLTYAADESLLEQVSKRHVCEVVALNVQYRAHPECATLWRCFDLYYEITDHQSTSRYMIPESTLHRTFWMDCRSAKNRDSNVYLTHYSENIARHVKDTKEATWNLEEVRMAVAIAGHFIGVALHMKDTKRPLMNREESSSVDILIDT